MTEQPLNILENKTLMPHNFQLTSLWINVLTTGSATQKHCMIGPRAQFISVVKALPRDFTGHIRPSMFTSDGSEPYDTLKELLLNEET